MSRFHPYGLATGIGSVPFTDPDKAIRLIRKHCPAIPHWPQMPRLGRTEHFIFQCLRPLVDTGLLETGTDTFFFDTRHPDWPDRLTDFYTLCLAAQAGDTAALENFVPPKSAARGFHALLADVRQTGTEGIQFLKGQIAGPLTAGLELRDERGRSAYYHGDLRDVIVRTLALSARCQAAALSQFGCPAILFVDDPAICAYGSAFYLTLTREMIIEDLNTVFRAIHSENALAGLHSCDAIDWSVLFDSDMRILSLDVFRYGDSLFCHAPQINAFLESRGMIAWGIVPTLDDPFAETPDTLLSRLERLFSELVRHGADPRLLVRQSMITPACGTGLLSAEQARRIYELTSAVSEKLAQSLEHYPQGIR